MKGYTGNIEKVTEENTNYRQVLYTGPNLQLVVMSLKPGEEIGEENHSGHDQFFRIESGLAKVVMDGEATELRDGEVAIVPAGTTHNVINLSEAEDLRLYTLYAPPEHEDGVIHVTKEDACEAEKTGEHM